MDNHIMDATYDDLEFKQIKLANGEEIVGFIISESEYDVIIEMPHLIDITDGVIRMRPWFEMSDQSIFKIEHRTIVQTVELSTDYKEYFLKLITQNDIEFEQLSEEAYSVDEEIEEALDEMAEIDLMAAHTKRTIH